MKGLAVLLAGLALAPAAHAALVPLPPPPGGSLRDFAASGTNWLAVTNSVQLSQDSGMTWRRLEDVDADGFVSVAPDGSFWLRARRGLLHRVAPDGSVSQLQLAVDGQYSAPGFDSAGRMWVTVLGDETVAAVRINPDGTEAERRGARTTSDGGFTYIRFLGGDGYAATGDGVWRIGSRELEPMTGKDGVFTPITGWPVFASGRTFIGFRTLSDDGGRTLALTTRQQFGVYGNDDLLVRLPVPGGGLLKVMRRCRPWIFCESGLELPFTAAAMWQTTRGLVAVSMDSSGPVGSIESSESPLFALHSGPLPPLSPPGAAPVPGAAAVLRRLNHYRRDAGLHPLVEDRRLSHAARNHARYLDRNRIEISRRQLGHGEDPGKPGFTGVEPTERCEAVGAICNAEDIIQGPRPVDTMMRTYYHRLSGAGPFTQTVGIGRAGRFTVFNFNRKADAIPLRPSGFPSGRYDGPLRFVDGEVPNPLDFCGATIPNPRNASIPVTFEPPARSPSRPATFQIEIRDGPDVKVDSVQLYQGKRKLRGCTQRLGAFIGAQPLRRRTRYTARARWRPNENAAPRTFTWSFRTR